MSSWRKPRANERAVFRAAANDRVIAQALEEVVSGRRSSLRMLDPRLAFRLSAFSRIDARNAQARGSLLMVQ